MLMGLLYVIILGFPWVILKTINVDVIAMLQGKKFVEDAEKQEGTDDGDDELLSLHYHSAAPCFH